MIRILRQIFHTGIVTERWKFPLVGGTQLEETVGDASAEPCDTAGGCRLL
jgi:hypothetical protein